jgi:hypothetical protein
LWLAVDPPFIWIFQGRGGNPKRFPWGKKNSKKRLSQPKLDAGNQVKKGGKKMQLCYKKKQD